MAEAIKKGVEAGGGTATLLQIPESLPAEVSGFDGMNTQDGLASKMLESF